MAEYVDSPLYFNRHPFPRQYFPVFFAACILFMKLFILSVLLSDNKRNSTYTLSKRHFAIATCVLAMILLGDTLPAKERVILTLVSEMCSKI